MEINLMLIHDLFLRKIIFVSERSEEKKITRAIDTINHIDRKIYSTKYFRGGFSTPQTPKRQYKLWSRCVSAAVVAGVHIGTITAHMKSRQRAIHACLIQIIILMN